jgi:nicotinate-nucleotide--dimethylbenzimidazole phosphoribosyltransferase
MNTIEKIIERIRPLDAKAMAQASQRQDRLTKPRGSLGRLEGLSIQIAGITTEPIPGLQHKAILTMAADHGVTAQGISLYPAEVTRQMVLNFLEGGAAINVLSRMIGARVIIVDMGVRGGLPAGGGITCRPIAHGTKDMSTGPAMTHQQALDCLLAGIGIVEKEIKNGLDILGTGDMGIGNTTSAGAITAIITGQAVSEVTGRGTGIDDAQLEHKVKIIERSLAVNRPDPTDAIDVLAKVGGFEIGGLAGAMLAAAANHIPVIIDGFISGAAALIASGICPQAGDYMIASHLSAEKGHAACLKYLNLEPILKLNLRLGEGTGAALGIFLAESSVNLLREMATFSEAGVSDIQ